LIEKFDKSVIEGLTFNSKTYNPLDLLGVDFKLQAYDAKCYKELRGVYADYFNGILKEKASKLNNRTAWDFPYRKMLSKTEDAALIKIEIARNF